MTLLFKAATLWLFALGFIQLPPSHAQQTDAPSKIIESFHVKTDIRFRFATTQMVSVVRNIADQAQEIAFDVTLPKEAFIVNFSMAIDGKEYIGEVKEKNAAKRQYQSAVDRGQSAGHIRQAPRHSNVFEVSVNVANGSAVNFTLTYQELLRRKLGLYEHEIHVNPGQTVEDFSIEIFIQENRRIPIIRTPALRKEVLLSNDVEEANELAVIERPTVETAHITYAPTLKQQGDGGVSARFAIQYDVDHSDQGEVLVVDGYFLHFYAPDVPSLPKDIIFVLDVSGSMSGHKIAQLKDSMVIILKDLSTEDRFNILTFSNHVRKWKNHLTDADSGVIQEAIGFVREMRADGGTDINRALLRAVAELRGREIKNRVAMIFFLTDGEPTSGVTNKNAIATNVRNSNNDSAAIFGLAFGDNADFDILKTICGQNLGFARKIYEASDSALQVASLYDEISAVAMKNVKVEYLPGITKTTETVFPIVFNGTEIVICGILPRRVLNPSDNSDFAATISGIEKSGDVDVVLNIDNVNEITIDIDNSLNTFFTIPRDYSGIVEKMWAFLTIKQLLKEKERVTQDEVKAEKLSKEILAMSLKYNLVTPLTSMVVTKPGNENKDEKFESGLEDVDNISNRPHPSSWSNLGIRGVAHGLPGLPQGGMMHSFPMGRQSSKRRRPSSPRRRLSKSRSSGQYDLDPQSFPATYLIAMTQTDAPTTPTTTTTTTTPTTHTGKTNKGKGGRGNNKAKGMFPVLSSFVIRSSKTSICISPRKIMMGTYTLLEGLNGQLKLEITTGCMKRCRLVLADTLNLTYKGDRATVKLSSMDAWHYSQGRHFNVLLVGHNQINITTPTPMIEVLITRNQKKRKVLYDIEITMKTQEAFNGLLAKLQTKIMKRRKSRKMKVPKSCRNKQVSTSMKLSKKFARRYMQQPSP